MVAPNLQVIVHLEVMLREFFIQHCNIVDWNTEPVRFQKKKEKKKKEEEEEERRKERKEKGRKKIQRKQ